MSIAWTTRREPVWNGVGSLLRGSFGPGLAAVPVYTAARLVTSAGVNGRRYIKRPSLLMKSFWHVVLRLVVQLKYAASCVHGTLVATAVATSEYSETN